MTTSRPVKRTVSASLAEASPEPTGYWILASPLIGFVGWIWVDLFVHFSPIPSRWIDTLLALLLGALAIILPAGLLAHWIVTAAPRLFQNAGWDVTPLEPVSEAEQYMVRYRAVTKQRLPTTWRRLWIRAAQGWVYLEIAAIFLGAVALIPVFLSATDFGFGR